MPHCKSVGYKGRIGIYELLVVDQEIQGDDFEQGHPKGHR